MKIKCSYCGTMFDDTKTHCPSCGAVNEGVVRTTGKQPITIDELKKWYTDRGLPPYETTRFFIGIDYRKPRAFGIYKDKKSGNFIVYKNKDNGQRAIRYEGTDEAYAVNELYQRLKEEIIQQKRHNVEKQKSLSPSRRKTSASGSFKANPVAHFLKIILKIILVPVIISVSGFIIIIIIGTIILIFEDTPEDGYYDYSNAIYYHYDHSEPAGKTDWFVYDSQDEDWIGPLSTSDRPEELAKNKKAKNYFLSEELPSEMEGHSFKDSLVYQDALKGNISKGYYNYEDEFYYYLDSSDNTDWYYYDTYDEAWYEAYEIPEDLTHSSLATDFYYTPVWDSETQLTDFTDTEYYATYQEQNEKQSSTWEDNNDDSDYDWDTSDSWDSSTTTWDSDW